MRDAVLALPESWRSFRTAAWLGWQIESNWTKPHLFALYAIAKPLAAAGIIVMMYAAVSGGTFTTPVFAYVYLGSTFYGYVGAVMTGMAFSVIEDRERYKMLRAIYVAPGDFRWYLVGRGVARFMTASVSVVITLAVGIVFLDLPINLGTINVASFLLAMLLGMVMLAALGLLLSGVILTVAHQSWAFGEAAAGALYLFSGALFPLNVLPGFLQSVGYVLPLTYWLELLRRSLLGSTIPAFPGLASVSDLQLAGIVALLTGVLVAMSLVAFGFCEEQARERGLIDRTTNY